jgi:DNA-binding Lrp family transcriptional regulator
MSLFTENPHSFYVVDDAEAFIVLRTALGEERRVIEKLRQLDGLLEVHNVNGSYDILARFRTKKVACLRKLLKEVKMIDGVRSTRNLLIT